METKQLQVKIRKDAGSRKAQKYRKSGLIPAILYGHKQENLMFLINEREFINTLHSETKMVNLKWDGSEEIALIKYVQFDTFGKEILHVDFVRIALTEKITTQVPIALYGTSPGVKEGGILDHSMKEVEIECLPTEIPKNIRINISGLAIGNTIHIKDIELPPNVKTLGNPDAIVVSIYLAAEEKETLEEEVVSEPEVISARKSEKEEEAESKD
ncbi:MAG: 50S ribosomal protein L25 (TL5) [Candidatus Scalindua rubra]|uniref:Large ribosomal subunit protein bL25 n=1 Tax=Candidatus Scalindua rubra TaxID=1872076 RepID=A0A1E3X5Q4_9BACT|nr:MAG: 50S ribosomal protein L25 (TL5) [Candidatus Scalindua rubra]